jgi:hypothetical protein
MITNDARRTRDYKTRNIMAKVAPNWKNNLLSRKLELNLRKRVVKCYIWSTRVIGAENWTLPKLD